jgi:hypothetical protein
MWDAILVSVPKEDAFVPPTTAPAVASDLLGRYAGRYNFGPNAQLTVTAADGQLSAQLNKFSFFDLGKDAPVKLIPLSDSDFYVAGRYLTRLSFVRDAFGKVTAATVNPGPWQQAGTRDGD